MDVAQGTASMGVMPYHIWYARCKRKIQRTKMTKTYDTKCYELAGHFLADEPSINNEHHKDLLAACIQQAIEDYIEWNKDGEDNGA